MTAYYDVIASWLARWETHFVEPAVFGTTQAERQTLQAAKIYSLAYSARCEHALHPDETTYPEESCRAALARYKANVPSFLALPSSPPPKEG